ncbi:hypothetical protein BABINDRAFT_160541 [Babjeviella inositovora NRRL Y-12698]|uniref:Uncharacterized protein n=1 Tax=Babjeviella inositovora NRRL Y-12698 TaxID=984486 RepID=A0A1E3QU02_9ASCO|nr:uncharacterized protein BABINDRAFT_160541 [Babjeviella inositovora NRRL Y-12698]ODQ81140.1 hypothetical protein BABINDRAFT_160541 [Babjeviella inositovora NRRL Y-12698]
MLRTIVLHMLNHLAPSNLPYAVTLSLSSCNTNLSASTWAPLPATTRALTTHLSYDPTTDRIAYALGKSIFIRSVSDPSLSWQFTGHTHTTTVARFSPSGYYIASGDESGQVQVWDCSLEGSQSVKSSFQIISGRINDLSWDADSKRIIAVGDGKEKFGHCFTFDTGNSVGEISGHSAAITAVAIRPVRPFRAVTVANDSALVVLSAPPYKFQSSVRGNHSNFIRDVKYSPDGEFIVSVGADRAIVVYSGAGELVRKVENAHDGGIFAVSWVNSTQFVTSAADSTVKLWSTEGTAEKTWTFEKAVATHQVGVVATKTDIISLSLSGELNFLSLDSDAPVRIVKGHQKSITAIAVGERLYTGSYDGRIAEWDLQTKSASYLGGTGHTNMVIGLNNLGDSVSSVGWDDKLLIIDQKGSSHESETVLGGQPKGTASHGTTTAIVTESELLVFELGTQVHTSKLDFIATSVTASATGIIVGGQNGSLNVFDAKTYARTTLAPLRSAVSKVALSASGSHLAVADTTGKIVLYETTNGTVVTSRWSFHNARVTSMSWHGDEFLVSGSLDEQIIVYSVARPAKNIKFPGAHYGGVTAVAWLGEQVVSGGNDGVVKLWDVKFHA